MSKSEDRLPEDLRGVMFLMHYRYGRGRRIVLGCEKWVEDTYDRLVQLGLLAKNNAVRLARKGLRDLQACYVTTKWLHSSKQGRR